MTTKKWTYGTLIFFVFTMFSGVMWFTSYEREDAIEPKMMETEETETPKLRTFSQSDTVEAVMESQNNLSKKAERQDGERHKRKKNPIKAAVSGVFALLNGFLTLHGVRKIIKEKRAKKRVQIRRKKVRKQI